MSEKQKELMRTAKFLLFSVGAAAIQIGSFTLLNEVFSVPYWLAYLISCFRPETGFPYSAGRLPWA